MNLFKKRSIRVSVLVSLTFIAFIITLELYGFIYLPIFNISNQNNLLYKIVWRNRRYISNFRIGNDDAILDTSRHVSKNYEQMIVDQINDFQKVSSSKVNVLIWRFGNYNLDLQNNIGWKVIFIQEGSLAPKVEQVLNDKIKKGHLTYKVNYRSISDKLLLTYLNHPENWQKFDMYDKLPVFVKQKHWHLIIVQSTFDSCGTSQRRYQAIFTSWKLANVGTHIIVGGFECKLEQTFSVNIFGKPIHVIKEQGTEYLKTNERAQFIVNTKNVFKPITDRTKIDRGIDVNKNGNNYINWLSDIDQKLIQMRQISYNSQNGAHVDSNNTTKDQSGNITHGNNVNAIKSDKLNDTSDFIGKKNGIQMSLDQVSSIKKVLPPSGNLLVWGLGNDSPYWHNSTDGKVIFIEDDYPSRKAGIQWYDEMMQKYPFLDVYRVHYKTHMLKSFPKYINNPNSWHELDLCDQLPAAITRTHWHVIIVDAPLGCCGTGPGRYQSIYTSWKLAKKGTHIFVDDFERTIEHEFSVNLFGKPRKVIKRKDTDFSKANKQAHFIADSKSGLLPTRAQLKLNRIKRMVTFRLFVSR